MSLDDLRVPPSNRLEALQGDLKGYYSIRVNDQWRIIFRWQNGEATDVEFLDYHSGERMTDHIEIEHPGVMLKEDFLDALEVRPGALAAAIKVDRAAIKHIIDAKRAITADMALRLGLFFGTSPEFWLNLQKDYELRKARRERLEGLTATIKPLKVA